MPPATRATAAARPAVTSSWTPPKRSRPRFPGAGQIAKVIRTRTGTTWKSNGKRRTRVTETSTETVYLVTSLTAREAGPEHVAAYACGHWSIEVRHEVALCE
jgi:hypothetical protein